MYSTLQNFFKYHSNKNTFKFFIKYDDFVKEYSYEIITNNFGLVQNNNISKKNSILFLETILRDKVILPLINLFNSKSFKS